MATKKSASKKTPAKKKAATKTAAKVSASLADSLSVEDKVSPWADDEQMLRARANVDTLVSGFNARELIDEIMNLHKTMKSRSLKTLRNIKDREATLVDAQLENQAIRSRVTEIELSVAIPVMDAQVVLDFAADYMRDAYGLLLNAVAKTQADRQGVIDAFFGKAMRDIRYLKNVQTVAATVIRDLDQGSFRFSGVRDVLKSTSARQ